MPITRITEILKGRRCITADTALRLSKYFGNSAQFWLGLQMDYDLRKEKASIEYILEEIEEKQAGNWFLHDLADAENLES